jgi:hypothetical protein
VSRRLWLLCTTAAFLALGSWRWIETKGPTSSLFDWVLETFRDIGVDMRDNPTDVLTGICFLLVWWAGYAVVSTGIGWLAAAVLSAIGQSVTWQRSQKRD